MKLHAGERVLYEGHPSWRAILAFYLKGIAAAAALAALVALATSVFGDGVKWGIVILILLAGTGLTILAGLLVRIATVYKITNARLYIKRGILSREVQETRLQNVQNVNHSQSFFERIVQVGTVDFDTAAFEDDTQFRFVGVADPEDVVHQVSVATHGEPTDGLGKPADTSSTSSDAPAADDPPAST